MSYVLIAIGFHKNGKPRGWLRRVLFNHDKTPRSVFRKVIFKKNGRVRPHFSQWVVLTDHGIYVWGRAGDCNDRFAIEQQAELFRQLEAVELRQIPAPPAEEEEQAPVPMRSEQEIAVATVLHGPPALEEAVSQWRHHRSPEIVLEAAELEQVLASARIGSGKFIICLSHDDYRSIPGGLQNCVRREQKRVNEHGADYLNLHPFQALPRLAHLDEDPDPFVNLVMNGSALGCSRMSSVIMAVQHLAENEILFDVVVHHLLGFQPEQVHELASAARGSKVLFWLHDFFTICPGFTLQRNDKAYCNAPALESNACNLCIYGQERPSHVARLKSLFESADVHIVSPSAVTLSLWEARTNFPVSSTCVAPHMSLDWTPREAPHQGEEPEIISIGYLGYHVFHKGWPAFERIAKALEEDPSFRFATFGAHAPSSSNIKWINVVTNRENESAMSEAVAKEGVDIVLHWPTWPETFSFTTFEAFAAGAYVVTNSISGNVATAVAATGCGVVLEDEASLLSFFLDGGAKRLAQEARRRRREFCISSKCSDMSAQLLFKGQ